MTDHNAWLGRWPFRDLGERGTAEFLLETMERQGIACSWVSPLDALFHRVPHKANLGLLRTLTEVGHGGKLVPIPVFHPGLADSVDYLDRCRSLFPDLAGVRLLPALHRMDGANMDRVIATLSDSGVRVVLTCRLMDAWARIPWLPLPELTFGEIKEWLGRLEGLPVVVAGCTVGEIASLLAEPGLAGEWCSFESSRMDQADSLDDARAILGNDRVLPGSNAPMSYQESMMAKWRET